VDTRRNFIKTAVAVTGCIQLALIFPSSSALADPLAATRLAPDEFKWEQGQFGI